MITNDRGVREGGGGGAPSDMIAKPDFPSSGRVKILVKPNAERDELLGFDDSRKVWRVSVSSPAEDNKANIAVIKLISKLTGKRLRIVAGLASKQKVLLIQ